MEYVVYQSQSVPDWSPQTFGPKCSEWFRTEYPVVRRVAWVGQRGGLGFGPGGRPKCWWWKRYPIKYVLPSPSPFQKSFFIKMVFVISFLFTNLWTKILKIIFKRKISKFPIFSSPVRTRTKIHEFCVYFLIFILSHRLFLFGGVTNYFRNCNTLQTWASTEAF